MDQERTLLIVAVGVAVAIGCFVIWGPSTFRTRKRGGQVVGLVNLGFTCFLNTLLQALASCPMFIDWLADLNDDGDCSLASTLRTVLLVLNGGSRSPVNDPYTPSEVIASLKRHRWVISPGEQDAHELFHVLLETLEEEATSTSPKTGCLSDALLIERCGQGDDSAVHKSLLKRSLSSSVNCEGDQHAATAGSRLRPMQRMLSLDGDTASLQRTTRPDSPRHPLLATLPFRGTLTSQLKCTTCGFKTALRFDKFDTLSLPLPTSSMGCQRLTLQMLLDNFVSTELVKDVTCANCSRGQNKPIQTTASKSLNFGKLPKCLCFHIVRTTWNQDGLPCKREDYVDFSEFLVMDNYTHSQVQRNSRRLKDECEQALASDMNKQNGTMSSHSQPNGVVLKAPAVNGKPKKNTEMDNSSNPLSSKHLYRLKAVVVHMGDTHSGHFVTYRKGPIKSLVRHRLHHLESNVGGRMGMLECKESTRWYYTSDAVVRQATLCEALMSNAYMLFYEKCLSSSQYQA